MPTSAAGTPEAPPRGLTTRSILRYWAPLEATWLMMAAEGPFLAALIARLSGATPNLAAYGVVVSLAWIVESPIMMMLSAANALVRDRAAFLRLRRFAMRMNAAVTAAMIVLASPPVFDAVARRVVGLPPDVARLAARAMLPLVVWPGAIGFRRFYQGILIRAGRPRAVTIGTAVRLSSMAAAGLALALAARVPGALVGTGALAAGVVAEAAASWAMARGPVRRLLSSPEAPGDFGRTLTFAAIGRFYAPLALTSILTLSMHPLTAFFLGRSRFPIESLAVLPVVGSLVFLFRTPGIACQEVVIALAGDRLEQAARLRRFAFRAGAAAAAGLAVVTFTPLAGVWLGPVSGLAPELARFAVVPARVFIALPAIEAFLSLRRGLLVRSRRTAPVVAGMAAQIAAVVALLAATVVPLRMVGANAAAIAQLGGYAAGALALAWASRRIGAPAPAPVPGGIAVPAEAAEQF